MELLAPAGSLESLKAGIACGANAIYLGGKEFNARRNANNFDDVELEDAIAYAHVRGVKIYLTMNIILLESELEQAQQAILSAAKMGIDAIIVQDLAVACLVKELVPAMEIHASTQMSVHNLEGVAVLEELGFSRAVLARELTEQEITYIAKNAKIELEVFVHGALCMSVSGQCYLSSMIGERSGNRGTCAQPCRLPLKTEYTEYALSLKDLSIIDKLQYLQSIGVASAKIEGRMKRPEYVAAAVTACKNALSGTYVDMDTLQSVFSRDGFTNGYFSEQIDGNMFGTRNKQDVIAAKEVLGELAGRYRNEAPLVPITFVACVKNGQAITLQCTDDNGNMVQAMGEVPQIAQNKPTDKERLSQNLNKTGATPYYVQTMDITLDDGLMVPVSEINRIRRTVLDELTAIRSKKPVYEVNEKQPLVTPKHTNIKIPSIRSRLHRQTQLTDTIEQQSAYVILPLDELEKALKNNKIKETSKYIAELPRMIYGDATNYIQRILSLKENGIDKIIAGNLYGVKLAQDTHTQLFGDFGLNIVNSLALKTYHELGMQDATISIENNMADAKQFGDFMPYGMIAYGYLPLMLFRNCPIKIAKGCAICKKQFHITPDRKENPMTISCSGECSQMYNFVPLYLADNLKQLQGFDFITLYFTKETAFECQEILKKYQTGGNLEGQRTRGLYQRHIL